MPRGIAVADRDGQSFGFAYGDADGMASELRDNARKAGVDLFTRVRFKAFDVSTLPRDAEPQAAEAITMARKSEGTGELGSYGRGGAFRNSEKLAGEAARLLPR